MNREETKRKLLETYWKTDNISETARQWRTSRRVVRKWVRRYEELGSDGIIEHSRRPHHCPTKTSKRIEKIVIQVSLWLIKNIDVSPPVFRNAAS